MKFLLYTTTYGKSGSVQLSHPGFLIPAALGVCSLLCGAGSLGYLLASKAGLSAGTQEQAGEMHWQAALDEQKRELAQVRSEAENQLNALAVRLGQMQSQVLRIEALGQRVTEVTGLSKSEFDFDQLPARGGPAEPLDSEPLARVDFIQTLDELALQIDDRARQLEVMEQLVSQHDLDREMAPAGQPTKLGWLSSYFGKRTDPFNGRREMHKGMDFAGQMGADVIATAAGVVTWAGKRYGYGQLVEINHGNGIATRYGHCNALLVKVGDRVDQGQVIALMGSSGRSTGPHVHYEVLNNGRQVNPAKYVSVARQPAG
jgi:murein DD-endopeptidase MepM/ murein hydrolase activator NlpD